MVTIGRESYLVETVRQVLAGYAFKTERIDFDPGTRTAVGDPPVLEPRPVWGYRSYDCVPADSGALTDRDLLVSAGLNGRVDSKAFLSLRAAEPEVSRALQAIPDEQTFWDLDAKDIAGLPGRRTGAWSVWRAWWVLMCTPDVGLALTHKVLHHKRPALFPLLDNQTVAALPPGRAWLSIHQELTEGAAEFEDLENWFADQAVERNGVRLTRLRIHDIVLWCSVSKERHDIVLEHGREVLGGRSA